jgi:hypothetical protein
MSYRLQLSCTVLSYCRPHQPDRRLRRAHYNHCRYHESLGNLTPAEVNFVRVTAGPEPHSIKPKMLHCSAPLRSFTLRVAGQSLVNQIDESRLELQAHLAAERHLEAERSTAGTSRTASTGCSAR